jgi:hypothetical protein
MLTPRCKINIGGTDYENIAQFANVKRRECNYDIATLIVPDNQYSYDATFNKFDEVKVYFKDATDANWGDPVFGGYIREKNPSQSETIRLLTLNCKGYGAALEDTNCNRDYGTEASDPAHPQAWNILKNITAEFVNKSFDDTNTGYTLDNTYISDYCGTDIKYINNPYRTNMDVANTVCKLTSAIGGGATAGGHWIVDASNRFLFAKIGDHAAGGTSPETYWPNWWNTDQAGSTLAQGTDFQNFSILDKTEEYANNVILITDFRRPSYDFITESGALLWGYTEDVELADDSSAGDFVVGANSLWATVPNGGGWIYYPSTQDAGWDVTKWGSAKTIPTLNFYFKADNLSAGVSNVRLCTTNYNADYFKCMMNTWSGSDNTWYHVCLPIGPYYATANENKKSVWTSTGSPNWANINAIAFDLTGPAYAWIDDLHFKGKIIREAKHSQAITAYNEYQKILIARNAMDDSCTAADDTGFAGRIAYAELLRRIYQPKTVTFTITTNMKAALAGQKIHVHAGLKSDSSYSLNADMRIIELQHNYAYPDGYQATVTATTDLANSFPTNIPDQYAMWQENMFINSAEAKNIRASAEVDLLIPRLVYDYGP